MGCCGSVDRKQSPSNAVWLPLPAQQYLFDEFRVTHPTWCSHNEDVVAMQIEVIPDSDGLDMDFMDRLGAVLNSAIQHIHSYGGYVASCNGLSCLSIFSPAVHTNVPLYELAMRAVQVACLVANRRFQEAVDGDNSHITSLEFKCAVASGCISTAIIGGKPFWQWVVMGPVLVDIAESLKAAKPRQTVLNRAIAEMLDGVLLCDHTKNGLVLANGIKTVAGPLIPPRPNSKGMSEYTIQDELLTYFDPLVMTQMQTSQNTVQTASWESRDALIMSVGLWLADGEGDKLVAMHTFIRHVQEIILQSRGSVFNCMMAGNWLRVLTVFEWKEASKALLAALRIQLALSTCHNAIIGPVAIGLARGPAFGGVFGSRQTFKAWSVVGLCCQEAARLMRIVGASTIICSSSLFPHVQDTGFQFVKTRDKDPVLYQLEGFPKLYPYWDSRLGMQSRGVQTLSSYSQNLLKVLRNMDGSMESLTIVKGEVGVGKSTFMAALHQQLLARKNSVLWCHGDASVSHIPFAPWLLVIVRILAGRKCVVDANDMREGIQSTMTQWFGSGVRKHLPLLNFVFGSALWESSEDSMLPLQEKIVRIRHLFFRILEEWCDAAKSLNFGTSDVLNPISFDEPGFEPPGSPLRVTSARTSPPRHPVGSMGGSSNRGSARGVPNSFKSQLADLSDLPGTVGHDPSRSLDASLPSRSTAYGPSMKNRSSPAAPGRVLLVDHVELLDEASLLLLGLVMQVSGLHIVVACNDTSMMEEAVTKMSTYKAHLEFLRGDEPARRQERPPLDRFSAASYVLLGPMSFASATSVLEQILHVKEVPEQVAMVLYECSNGNSAIFMEVVRSLVERNVLPQRVANVRAIENDPVVVHMKQVAPKGLLTQKRKHEEGMGAMAGSMVSAASTVRLETFLDSVENDVQTLLQTAAIIGHEFTLRELMVCLSDDYAGVTILASLTEMCQVGYLFCIDWSEKHYKFVNGSHREILEARVQQKHRQQVKRLLANYYISRGAVTGNNAVPTTIQMLFANKSVPSMELGQYLAHATTGERPEERRTEARGSHLSIGSGNSGASNKAKGSALQRRNVVTPYSELFATAAFKPSKITFRACLTNPLYELVHTTEQCIDLLGKSSPDLSKLVAHLHGNASQLQELGHHDWTMELLEQALGRLDKVLPASGRPSELHDRLWNACMTDAGSEVDEDSDNTRTWVDKEADAGQFHWMNPSSDSDSTLVLTKKQAHRTDRRSSAASFGQRSFPDLADMRELTSSASNSIVTPLKMELAYLALQSCRLLNKPSANYTMFLRLAAEATPNTDQRWFYAQFARWFTFGHLGEDPTELGTANVLMESALACNGKERDRRLAMALMAAVVADSVLANHPSAIAQCDKLVSLHARSPESCSPPPYIPIFAHSYMHAAVYGCRSALYSGRYRMYTKLLTSSWDACTRLWTRHPVMYLCLLPYLAMQLSTVWLKRQQNHLAGLLDQFTEISSSAQDRRGLERELLVHAFYQSASECQSQQNPQEVEVHLNRMVEHLAKLEQSVGKSRSAPVDFHGGHGQSLPGIHGNHLLMLELVLATTLKDHKKLAMALEIVDSALERLQSHPVPECVHPEFFRLRGDILLLQKKVPDAEQNWMDAIALALEYGANHFALRAGLRVLEHEDNLKHQKIVEGLMRKVDADMNVEEYARAHQMTSSRPV
eukprot:GGOE01058698.1.p1 GENE.GGOE01058698.1~~GGOE01058698.1.p1  ORF type:complete len:1684 (+),score=425.77 GGOE01058698.1:86-5137(+)